MSNAVSLNTKAILLLTAPLIAGRRKGERSANLLTPREYAKLARHLQETGRQPADLLTPDADQLLGGCCRILDKDRFKRLLDRGFLLSQAIERWQTRAIWVASRADDTYPQKLKARLKKDSPILLYGCGDRKVLNSGGLAVVGSRNANDSLIEYTHEVGRLVAKARRTLVSGGARGVDQAAMRAVLEEGGRVVGVLADSLEKTAMNREHRNLLLEERLVLISPYDPNAGFNAGHAMQRNKVIYALADAALVVNADMNKGGTWAGAREQLEKLRLIPIYVRSTGESSKALDALKSMGGRPWPNPGDTDSLEVVFYPNAPKPPTETAQVELSLNARQESMKSELQIGAAPTSRVADNPASARAGELYQTVHSLIISFLAKPKTADEVAKELDVTKPQAQKWLKRLVAEEVLEKRTKPVSYVVRQSACQGKDAPQTLIQGF